MLNFMLRPGGSTNMTAPSSGYAKESENKERPCNANARFVESRQLRQLRGKKKITRE